MLTVTARRIKEHRLRRLLSQVELAQKAGLTVQTLSALERGLHPPRFVTLRALSRVLRVPVADLVDKPVADADLPLATSVP